MFLQNLEVSLPLLAILAIFANLKEESYSWIKNANLEQILTIRHQTFHIPS